MTATHRSTTAATISVGSLVRRFRGRIAVTFGLVVLEAAAMLLFPLFIGLAINDLLEDAWTGVFLLGGLGLVALLIGAFRRWIDTRTYATIYEITATDLVDVEHRRHTDVSSIAARSTLLTEFIEFLEESMPMIVNSAIGIVGTLIILARIDLGVFAAALGLAALVAGVYTVTGSRNVALTTGYNDELERQVTALATRNTAEAKRHFGRLMGWNRKLSDLETLNYSAIYLGVIALLVYSPIAVVDGGDPDFGFVFSTIVYVFQYVEAVLATPLFIQQMIRLREISTRLRAAPASRIAPTSAEQVDDIAGVQAQASVEH